MRKKVGIVADDITGSNDIGIMFAKKGYAVAVYPYNESLELRDTEDLDVIIIDTNSRFDTSKMARDKVFRATKKLMEIKCDVYHNKTCSVFRGNIGAEFDAMQEALGIKNSMVVLGFPKNGRTTIDGIHYVNGVKLEDSQFRKDPIHPMAESDLAYILSKQSDKRIGNITYKVLDQGIQLLQDEIEAMKKKYEYIIFDVRSQEDLSLIARAIKNEINICGSSAIGEELPEAWAEDKRLQSNIKYHKMEDESGVLIVAGSLTPQTTKQIGYLKYNGFRALELNTLSLYNKEEFSGIIHKIILEGSKALANGEDILIHTSNDEATIEATKAKGYETGMDDGEIGKIISNALSEIVKEIKNNTDFKKLIVAGGDTSASVSNGLGIDKMFILEEIEPGIPNMYGYSSSEEYLMVLKSGSFGSEGFLEKAVLSLRELQSKNNWR
jgi:uncharacterized protein YgbK (DUF1537 family)